ncbi:MAG: flagellar hook-length control protein FliK [Clostridiales bacterium]|nr:flagellar hook-length control protein FliK [Clostridiales bacterium]
MKIMEINEYRPKQTRLQRAASEYEASQVKSQQIKPNNQDQKPVQVNKKEHSIIKGEIIDLRYQEVKIRLEPSGQVITAKLSGELPLSIGQTAEFIISDEADGLITLRYIPSGNSPISDLIHKALYASGLSVSERNFTIVEQLLNYQMPVDKNTILQLIKLTSAYPDVNPSTLVLMHKNNLPINISNIAQFEAYQKGMHQILNQLKSLIKHIDTLASDITSVNPNLNIAMDVDISLNNTQSAQSLNINTNDINTDDTNFSNTNLDHVINLHKELLSLFINEESKPEGLSADTALEHILPEKGLIELKDMFLIKISESSLYNHELVENIMTQLGEGSMTLESLLNIVYDIYDHESLPLFSESGMLPFHIFEAFIDISSQISETDREKLVHLLKSDSYSEILTETLHQRWTLSPGDLPKDNKVKEFFKRLDRDMESLNKLTDSFIMSSDVKSSINKLQDNLQFMKELNELFLYLQLPIRFKEQDIHGDLYVFTRKNQKYTDTEKLNVLLHLEMTNLGSMDIHMSMINRQLNAVFYLEKSSEQLIAKYLHELIDTLKDKGYQLQAKTQISDSKPDFIADILQDDAPSSNTHRYSFDIRA